MLDSLKNQHWLIVANGAPLPKNRLNVLLKGKKVLALDGAYNHLKTLNITPDVLLGDFDSIHQELLDHAKKNEKVQVHHTPDQNKTDLDKGVSHLHALQAKSIDICSAVGDRLDHSLLNLRLLKRYYQKACPINVYTNNEKVFYLQDQTINLHGKVKQKIGILGAPVGRLTSQGLLYEVTDYELDFEKSSSTSNQFSSEAVILTVQGSAFCIIELL